MRKKVALMTVGCICFFILMSSNLAYACEPIPWEFEEAYESKAMVYGKVTHIENDGRKATLDVISYAGPGQAPQSIQLPETVDDRYKYPAGSSCPDFSIKFKAGEEHIFFLSDIPPNLQLLSPSWITASFVEEGQVAVGWVTDEKDSVKNRLEIFAEKKGYTIQSPNKHSPVWGESSMWLWPSAIVIGLCVMAGIYYRFLLKPR